MLLMLTHVVLKAENISPEDIVRDLDANVLPMVALSIQLRYTSHTTNFQNKLYRYFPIQ